MDILFDEFENAVMRKLLDEKDEILRILFKQYNMAEKQRQFTGSGFFTNFKLPVTAPRLPNNNSFQFGDVIGEINDVMNGIGFILFVKDGYIDMLEGYTYEEAWPKNITQYNLSYITGGKRDIKTLSKKWL